MRFRETRLDGAWIIEAEPARDERGSFTRTFCVREFRDHGLECAFVQHSLSHSLVRHTLRGMHFQTPPHAETKLVSCLRGAILDVIVDLRPGSATYLQSESCVLDDEERRQFYVPKGFAHGFMTLTDDVLVQYLISGFHTPAAARGLRYDDPALDLHWPASPSIVSARDLEWPMLGRQEA